MYYFERLYTNPCLSFSLSVSHGQIDWTFPKNVPCDRKSRICHFFFMYLRCFYTCYTFCS